MIVTCTVKNQPMNPTMEKKDFQLEKKINKYFYFTVIQYITQALMCLNDCGIICDASMKCSLLHYQSFLANIKSVVKSSF